MPRIFLSYNKNDRVLAERVGEELRRLGFTVWWDEQVTPREHWDRVLEREISAAEHVLVLWTRNSVESDWVRIEANFARNCKPSKLVQARFNHVQIPIAFSLIQYVDLDQDRPEVSASWAKLLDWLGAPPDLRTGRSPKKRQDRASLPSTESQLRWKGLATLLAGAFSYLAAVVTLDPASAEPAGIHTTVALTPLFGIFYVFLYRVTVYEIVYFTALLTLIHYGAFELGRNLFPSGAPPTGSDAKAVYLQIGFVSGAFGGFASLGVVAIFNDRLRRRDGAGLTIAGGLVLAVSGAIGLALMIGPGASQVRWAYLYLPWQACFAAFLIRLLPRRGARLRWLED